MTLLARLVIGIVLLFGIGVGVTVMLNERAISASYAELEQEAAHKELARLVKTLDNEVQSLAQLLLGWAHWTALYDHAQRPDATFRAENLSPAVLGPSDLSWVMIIDDQGQLLDAIGATPAISQALASSELTKADSAIYRALIAPMGANDARCAVVVLAGQPHVSCRMPIRDTAVTLPPRGVAVLARPLDERLLARVEDESQLLFQLNLQPRSANPDALASATLSSPVFGSATTTIDRSPELLQLHFPLRDILGQPFAELALSLERTISARGNLIIHQAQSRTLLASLLLIGALLFVIDRLLVLRLRRLVEELNTLRRERNWSLRLNASHQDEIGRVAAHANALLEVIEAQMRELEQLSLTDPLTGMANRRAFDQRLDLALRQHRRHQTALSLIILDIDRFKTFNDHYGHSLGDAALKQVARVLCRSAARASDLPARIGGEEFAVLLENCTLDAARQLAEQLRQAVAELQMPHSDNPSGVLTISVGVAAALADEGQHSFFTRADLALYRAKDLGRNRVEIAPTPGQ